MTEHTPTPWKFIDATKEASMQYRPLCIIKSGEKQIASFSWNDNSPWFPSKLESQANAAFIVKAVNNHEALVQIAKILLGHDKRFQVAIGGNPNAVDNMLLAARGVLDLVSGGKQP